MFFQSWHDVGRVVALAVFVFLVIVLLLRLVGQKALAKMSGYDVVVTVTFGSLVATTILSPTVTLSDGVAALVTLIALQETTRWLQSRSLAIHHMVREPPRLVLWDGQLLEDRLGDANTSGDEVRAAVRKAGIRSLSDVRAVVLENDGEWSVLQRGDGPSDESALFGLPIPNRPNNSPADNDQPAAPAPPTRLP